MLPSETDTLSKSFVPCPGKWRRFMTYRTGFYFLCVGVLLLATSGIGRFVID